MIKFLKILPMLILPTAIYGSGDPFGFQTTVLPNGLTVVTSVNKDSPNIKIYTAVKAGSAQDPAESTGLAHYFEHMMFKGTSRIGALNWKKEKPLLDQVESLFEQYRAEKDEEKRKAIYAEIDRISGEASALANDEYWTLVRQMGAVDTNAFTSYEITAYESDIPANMLDRYLALEAERFSNIALRRFHTELETVYEEFNRTQASDSRQVFSRLAEGLYPDHPLGRPVIGLPAHLKNPSIRDVASFFKQYYIPENMVVILAGDIDHKQAVAAVERTLGKLPSAGKTTVQPLPPMPLPEKEQEVTITTPGAEQLAIAYRVPKNRETDYLFDLLYSILKNARCGLLDQNLQQAQKVLSVSGGVWTNSLDHVLVITATPLKGQSLDELRALILAEIGKLQNGDFDPAIIRAITNNDRLNLMVMAENRGSSADAALNLFQNGLTINDILSDMEKSEKATPEMVSAYAKKHLKNPLTLKKLQGENKDLVRAEKPLITPVEIPETPSPFAAELAAIPAGPAPEVEVPDFSFLQKDSGGLIAIKNDINERFTLTISIPAGSYNDLLLPLVLDYAELIGTEQKSLAEFNSKLYEYALKLEFSCDTHSTKIKLTGLQKNFTEACQLLNERLRNAKTDVDAWQKYAARTEKSRQDAKKDPMKLFRGTINYALYGGTKESNPKLNVVSSAEMKKLDPAILTDYLKDLLRRPFQLIYYGPAERHEVEKVLQKTILSEKITDPVPYPAAKKYRITQPEGNMVYTIPAPGAQILTGFIRCDRIEIPGNRVIERLLENYAGQTFFAELREKQSLGYVAQGYYAIPAIQPDNYSYFGAILGTQPDKLASGINGIRQLVNQLPENEDLFHSTRLNALSVLRSIRIKPESLPEVYENAVRLRQPLDYTRREFDAIEKMTSADFFKEAKDRMKDKGRDIWLLCGDVDNKAVDPAVLKQTGKVVPLTPDMILPE